MSNFFVNNFSCFFCLFFPDVFVAFFGLQEQTGSSGTTTRANELSVCIRARTHTHHTSHIRARELLHTTTIHTHTLFFFFANKAGSIIKKKKRSKRYKGNKRDDAKKG